jgi:hypothetical protein
VRGSPSCWYSCTPALMRATLDPPRLALCFDVGVVLRPSCQIPSCLTPAVVARERSPVGAVAHTAEGRWVVLV